MTTQIIQKNNTNNNNNNNNNISITQQQQKLLTIKKSLETAIVEIRKLGGNTDALETSVQETIKKIDNHKGGKIVEGLRTTFGNHAFKVTMENYIRPFASSNNNGGGSSSSNKNEYKYLLKNVSWINGPNTHQVWFYLKENFQYYLKTTEYNESLFTRSLPGIEKRHISWYLPLPIAGKEFDSIEIFLSKVYHRINEKTTMSYYIIDAVEPRLNIQNIKGETKQEVFERLQQALESIYYLPNLSFENKKEYKESTTQYKELMKKERRPEFINPNMVLSASSIGADLTGSAVDPDHDGDDDSNDPTDALDNAYVDPDEASDEAKEDPAEEAGESPSEESAEEASENDTDDQPAEARANEGDADDDNDGDDD